MSAIHHVLQRKACFHRLLKRLGVNFQTYALVVAMIVIWIFFVVMTGGILSLSRRISPTCSAR